MLSLTFAALTTCGGGEATKPDRWDLTLITVDTLRTDHLGYHGYERETSPRLDRFAEQECVIFDQAIVQWPKTTPSLASMLTSTYGSSSGIRGSKSSVPDKLDTLAEVLQAAGYKTYAIVFNPNLAVQFGFDQGFDIYTEAFMLEGRTYPAEGATNEAVRIMKDHPKNESFFLWVHYIDPHTPYEPPGDFNEMFIGDAHDLQNDMIEVFTDETKKYQSIGGISIFAQLADEARQGFYIAQYDAEIRATDYEIGRLIDELKRMGFYDNSMVIFTSDHGESLGENEYYFGHGQLPYDNCSRVPLLIRIPELKDPGRREEDVVALIDLMPTVLDFFGLPFPGQQVEGVSMADSILGQPSEMTKIVFTESGYRDPELQRSIRDSEWKLVFVPSEADQKLMTGDVFELYNIQKDPEEQENVAEQFPKVKDRLQKVLFQWIDSKPLAKAVPQLAEEDLNSKTVDQLRELGYVR
jgi:arylsulfatase A-like enzyme